MLRRLRLVLALSWTLARVRFRQLTPPDRHSLEPRCRAARALLISTALLIAQFASEDFCADTGIVRTDSRVEMLHARSAIVLAAKAYKLQAIDMVCVKVKDLDVLQDECSEGRRLGFDGKVRPRLALRQADRRSKRYIRVRSRLSSRLLFRPKPRSRARPRSSRPTSSRRRRARAPSRSTTGS